MVVVDLAVRLEAHGLATRTGSAKTLFIGSSAGIPQTDGPFVSLIETLGAPPLLTHNRSDGVSYSLPRVQVIWRGRDGEAIRIKAELSYAALFVTNEMINGTWYLSLRPLQEPFDLPPDANGRGRVAFNVEGLLKRP